MPNEFKNVILALGPELGARLQQRHRDEIARLCAEGTDSQVVAWRISMELRQEDAFARLAQLGVSDPTVFARAYALVAGSLDADAAVEQASTSSEAAPAADADAGADSGRGARRSTGPKP